METFIGSFFETYTDSDVLQQTFITPPSKRAGEHRHKPGGICRLISGASLARTIFHITFFKFTPRVRLGGE